MLSGAGQALFGSVLGKAQLLRQSPYAFALEIEEKERFAVARGERGKGLLEAHELRFLASRRFGGIEPTFLGGQGVEGVMGTTRQRVSSSGIPQAAPGQIPGDAAQPFFLARLVSQLFLLPPGDDENLLSDFVAEVRVSGDGQHDRPHSAFVAFDQPRQIASLST